jgi:sugar transferase (PEP-CTERM/EpsH1 system associated)
MEPLMFLCHRIPYPPDKGDKIRAWHMLSHLARTHDVHLGCLIDDPADVAHVPAVRAVCASVSCHVIDKRRQRVKALLRARAGRPLTLDYFYHAGLQAWVRQTLPTMSRLFVYSSAMARYVLDEEAATMAKTLDMVDVDSEKWSTYALQAKWPMRLIWAREGRTLLAFERRAARWFDHTLFVSPDECQRFETLAPETRGRVSWVENGVDLEYFSPSQAGENPYGQASCPVVFTGTMDYWPNGDAVDFFARSALPLLRRRRPDVTFHVVGANPTPDVQALASLPGVHVTGRVPDTRPYIAHAALAVAPLRIARGIQNKVLEAMAMARPVLASPQAFEGLRAQSGRDLLVAEGAEALADSAVAVLEGGHAGLGLAARQAVERGYAWPAVLQQLDRLL